MVVLHYALGFPPYRTGGLTKYCMDLMLGQKEQGNDVSLLWPGRIGIIAHQIKIKKRKDINGIHSYELINPLPIPLDEGIKEIDEFITTGDAKVYEEYLKQIKPDAIHIHTLMGIHKEFVMAANKLGIKTVFTTHDYFGLCPKVTFYKYTYPCDNDHNCEDCIKCNENALSLKKIQLMQSELYRKMKNSIFVKYLRKKHRQHFFCEDIEVDKKQNNVDLSLVRKYQRLRQFYIGILNNIDVVHFNSSVSKNVYTRYFNPKNSCLINITHKDIKDYRALRKFDGDKIRIAYLSPTKPFKGYFLLKNALDEMWMEGNRKFELHLFQSVEKCEPYMIVESNGYQYNDLKNIFSNTDVLIAPSVCYETFGFTVLEALSYGIPVIISENVGAKDIVGNGGWIIKANSSDDLKKLLLNLTPNKLSEKNKIILGNINIKSYKEFVEEINCLYT